MDNVLMDLIAQVNDEASFIRFLRALREDCETYQDHDCRIRYRDCMGSDHWETRSTKDFLKSFEDWASRGDFADGVHHGEPMLRRVATMLYVGKYFLPDDRPY